MVIAIAANSKDPESIVGSRFCTAKYFHLIDSETHDIKIIENEQSNGELSEVELKAADLIIDNGVKLVLAGNCGPVAFKSLSTAGIRVIAAVQEKIKQASKDYCYWDDDNEYSLNAEPCWNWR
jgi:predicted Fe-Mo cluster-binding NifX family protein